MTKQDHTMPSDKPMTYFRARKEAKIFFKKKFNKMNVGENMPLKRTLAFLCLETNLSKASVMKILELFVDSGIVKIEADVIVKVADLEDKEKESHSA